MKRNEHFKMQGDIKDRGIIKWQGMMSTDYMKMIRAWHEEDQEDVKLIWMKLTCSCWRKSLY